MKLFPELKRLIPYLAGLLVSVLILFSLNKDIPISQEAAISLVPEPTLTAHAYLVKFIGEEKPLASRRAWKKLPPASLTKLLTSVVARENLLPADWVLFSEDTLKTEEYLSGVKAGESLLRDDAIKFSLVASANDAALAIAESLGQKYGGATFEERLALFKNLTYIKVRSLGLANTSFKNPIGLDEDGHFSTAEDLARLAEYIWQHHPDLWRISQIKETVIYSDSFQPHRIKTTNDLLQEFPEILGGKTGFTDKALGTLILLYPVKDKVALIVILGSPDRFSDGRTIINWLRNNF